MFPKQKSGCTNEDPHPIIESKWAHRRLLLLPTTPTLQNLFSTWFHFTRYLTCKRLHQKQIKLFKKQQLQELLREVDQAAINHDSFKMHQIINRYSPKQPRKKIRLRCADGTPASSWEAQTLTQDYIRTHWHGPPVQQTPQVPIIQMPFTIAELSAEIARLPAVKSVAPPFLPGILWKNVSETTALLIFQWLQTWWTSTNIFIPAQWRDAWISFLSKPNKPPHCLANLRAIALMEPLGKTVLGILTRKFKPLVISWPQFAYIERRSAGDAIRRVSQHCHDTRTLLRNQRRTVHQRAAGVAPLTVCGGLQLFLDISRAFDELPRDPLFCYLRTLPIDQQIVSLLSEWHRDTHYITTHNNEFVATPTSCGIRQGCRAAPILWIASTNQLLETLAQKVGVRWVKQVVTLFADDIHAGTIFRSTQELMQNLVKFGMLLDAIEQHGLQISLAKSVLLLSIGGTNPRDLQRRLVQKGPNGFYVNIPRGDGRQSRLPVQNTACYLGVQMSYNMPENLTLQHRMKAARTAFSRLRKWLCARSITRRTKLRLWTSCIYSTLTYGLFASNITFTGLFKLATFMMSTLRKVAGDHSYITGTNNIQFLMNNQLKHPFAMLLHSVEQLQRMQCQRLTALLPQDILHTVDWTHLSSLTDLIQAAWDAQDPQLDLAINLTDEAPQPTFTCEWCSVSFDSLPNLRRHQTNIHGYTQLRTHQVTIAAFALHGLPICSHCHVSFRTWRSFATHLERNTCQVMSTSHHSASADANAHSSGLQPKDLALLMSKPYGPPLLFAVEQGTWSPLRDLVQAHEDLSQHCILCGLYFTRIQELNMHIRCQHGHLAANIFAKAAQLGHSQASITPCAFCQKAFLRQHQCPFWTQIALILVNYTPTGTAPDHADVLLRCEVCRQQFEDMQALHHPLYNDHRLEIHDWLPSRDMLGADPVCAHCLSCFTDKSAVRQHITRGQCPAFHAAKPSEELPVAQTWQQILLNGTLSQLRQAPMQRLSLTLHCQLCGVRFERQQDLALHLQSVHTERWTKTQTMVHLMLQVGHIDGHCICNPQTHAGGLSHVCLAYRQLSMLAQKMDIDLLLPWTFDIKETERFLAGIQTHATVEVILQLLQDRRFTELWLNNSINQLFRSVCLICGGTFHPAVLCEHVKAMHPVDCTWIPDLLPQLLPLFMADMQSDSQCTFCELVCNLPPEMEQTLEQQQQRECLVQIHAQHHCPVLYQAGLLLTHGLPTRTARSTDGRRGDLGSLQSDGSPTHAGSVRQGHQGRKRAKKTQKEPRSRTARTQHGSGQASASHGSNDLTSRCRPTNDAKTRLFRLLSTAGRTSSVASIDAESERMASTHAAATPASGSADGLCPTTHQTLPGLGDDAGGPSTQTLQGRSERTALDSGQGTWNSHGGREFSVSTMEPTTEAAQANQTRSCDHGAHDQVHDTVEGDLTRSHGNSQVPLVETDGWTANSPLDPPDWHQTRRNPESDGSATGMHGMGAHWGHNETSHAVPKQAMSPATTDAREGQGEGPLHQGQIQRQGQAPSWLSDTTSQSHLRACFEVMTLLNLANWCYANTAVLTMLWTTLTCRSFSLSDWGPQSAHIVHFLQNAGTTSIHLPDVM